VGSSTKLLQIAWVFGAVRAVGRHCLQGSIQGLLNGWVEAGLKQPAEAIVDWSCSRCGARQRGSFRRDGCYCRQLSTMAGVIVLDVPRLRCRCGAHVSLVFPVLEPRRRHCWDVWMTVIEGLGPIPGKTSEIQVDGFYSHLWSPLPRGW